jgi:hypothetical protein
MRKFNWSSSVFSCQLFPTLFHIDQLSGAGTRVLLKVTVPRNFVSSLS